ncbi:transcriptional regulator with XRE-family HTH domain [Dysgonomonas hofstadii]|uniref:Transcriptional regulator with XRE-family HTH domain n=1 Tax=Dysgonomonas hofstadii TaxID=637886 RepID=A0A840CY23_9BACT|nr:helix-turn-helix transcriptional regulator [Dysgonomonas hofstadii]MBB4037655.1 transcriptional regulator with XRE-family HTH domain [Dysgonomonas hofstadii]
MEELRIKEILKHQGKTMQDLADMIGINRVNLSNSLNGNPTLERLKQVAEYLNVDLKDLFKETQKKDIEVFGLIKLNEDVCIIDSFPTLEEVYSQAKLLKDHMV